MSNNAPTIAGGNQFPDTVWTRIISVGAKPHADRRELLGKLVELYWKPVYSYARMAGRLQSADAKDLTQAFFVRFLEKRLIEQLDPERGSFRGFLKRSLRNFIIDEARKRSARSPADGKVFSYEEEQDAAQLPTEVESAEAEFEREWRVTVIWRALKALDKRLEKSGLGGHYVTFKSYCLPDGDLSRSQLLGGIQPANRLTYAELAKQLDLTPTGVRHQLAYCRQELRQIVEQEVRQYVLHEQDVASELKFLLGG